MKASPILFLLLAAFSTLNTFSQDLVKEKEELYFKDGITARMKNDFFVRARFRMQNRLTYLSEDSDLLKAKSTDFRIRRARLRFDGHMYQEKFLYRLQLSFTRWDQDWDNSGVPNVLRDAVIGYNWHPNHTLWFGMTKLPGNRQRLISSGGQQFVNRSTLNSLFNLDRDTGIQHFSQFFTQSQPLWVKLAVANGQGRNQENNDTHLSTTARVEWYPLGSFHDDGDNFEADLFYETSPKLGMGAAFSYNPNTYRTSGAIGKILPTGESATLKTAFLDLFYKYKGHSISYEFAKREANKGLILDNSSSYYIVKGHGHNFQTGYVFSSKWEPVLRYSKIIPEVDIRAGVPKEDIYTLGLNKYLNNHVFKIQSDLAYHDLQATTVLNGQSYWEFRFQVEFGI
jgi:phosphate-selective porin OprO and OprP